MPPVAELSSDVAAFLKPGATKVDLASLEAIARGFLPRVAGFTKIAGGTSATAQLIKSQH